MNKLIDIICYGFLLFLVLTGLLLGQEAFGSSIFWKLFLLIIMLSPVGVMCILIYKYGKESNQDKIETNSD